ncbi:MAG: BatA and WFA domain-containing protein [Pirellulales bacterium]|nr:BatA and WFA domain-containing protein [Pirellulales bacterium]
MTFLHPLLLAGTALVAVPVVLHLIMRRKPKHVEFPALRLLQKRQETNKRRLRLRHLILLLLRMAAIAFLATALARPSVKFSGSIGSQEAPVAAVLVFDAAPRMQYRHENRTRLEVAQDLGRWLLKQLPQDSQIAVLDTQGDPAAFQVDRGAADQRIERLAPVATSRSLPAVLDEAIRLLNENEQAQKLTRKEIYVFTDLSRAAWPADSADALQKAAEKLPGVCIYLIDVGVKDPTDFSLGELRLSAQVLSRQSPLQVRTELTRLGAAGNRTVALFMLNEQGKPEKRDEQSVAVEADGSAEVEFEPGSLKEGVHQGMVRILGQDGLAEDDVRYFTVDVRPPWHVLIVDPGTKHTDVEYLHNMLSPKQRRQMGRARFACDVVKQVDLGKTDLKPYSTICLVDPTPMPERFWEQLTDYVTQGGALIVYLGRNAQEVATFNSPLVQALLPAKLVREARAPEGTLHLAPRQLEHPMLTAFRPVAQSVPWSDEPVYRYWELDKLAPGVNVVVPYNDDRPAVLERTVGEGRVITLTTPPSDLPDNRAWNLLPTVPGSWPFFVLTNQMMLHLVGGMDEKLNYTAGQEASISLGEGQRYPSYQLTAPSDVRFPLAPDTRRGTVTVTSTDAVGNYRIEAGGELGVQRGFSVNLTMSQTELTRATPEELEALFGPIAHRIARSRSEIERDVNLGRVGRELYPLLILLVVLILSGEHWVANRFYRE